MKTLYGLLVSLALAAGPAAAAEATPPAPPQTPDPAALTEPAGIIRDLYQRYYDATMKTSDASPMPAEFEWEAIADKYFTSDLAARFKKALASDEPVIDWDFFINGQDYADLKVISVAAATVDAKTSKVTIVTSNTGQQSTTIIDMTNAGDGWRIADFTFVGGGDDKDLRLTEFLKEAGF